MTYNAGYYRERNRLFRETVSGVDGPEGADHRPHPVLAPVAWFACLALGAGFWLAVFYLFA